jgi:hypothetical protein
MLHPIHAQPAPSLLRGGILSLHHHQLLPAPAIARQPAQPRPLLERAGTGAATLSFTVIGYVIMPEHVHLAAGPVVTQAGTKQGQPRN